MGGGRPQDGFFRNTLQDKNQGRVQDMGHRRTFEARACRGVKVAYYGDARERLFRCEEKPVSRRKVMKMSLCTARATWAAAGGNYGGDIPGSYSVANCPVGADRA